MWLDALHPKHHGALYKIAVEAEPYGSDITEAQFRAVMGTREGYVVVGRDGKLVGCISFSDFAPGIDIVLHCMVEDKCRGRWITRKMLKTVFGYLFEDLGLPRVSGFCIPGMSDVAGEALLRLGFKCEGLKRKSARLPDGFHDVKIFGMLKEECRWI